tara:strand:- start:2830 stop:3960 length:1131 start_codon:yes stop_codon:yes gene_type:complete
MKVIILFTYGISLKDWKSSGLLEREIKIYNYLSEKFGFQFKFITFGDESDLDYQSYIPNIEIIPIYKHINKSNNKYLELIRSFFYPLKIKKLTTFEKSIIKTNQLWGAWIAIILKLLTNNPLMIRTGYDLLTFKKNESTSKLKLLFYKYLTKISLKYSDKYIVTSKTDFHFLANKFKKYKSKISIIPNWIEKLDTIETKKFINKIVSVGRLEKQKNFQHLVMQISNSNLELDIYGEGSEKENLMEIAKKNNSNVNFLGRVSNIDLINKLTNYKYFVSSALYEGNPKALLEAMSAGCIVIAPNVSGINEIINNEYNGYLYELQNNNLPNFINEIEKKDNTSILKNTKEFLSSNHEIKIIAEKEQEVYSYLFNISKIS